MSVVYDSKKIIPAPFVKIDKNLNRAGDSRKVGAVYTLTITGTLVAYKGSPQGGSLVGAGWGGPFSRFWTTSGYPPDESVAADSRLKWTENKQEALRYLFATDGNWLEFQSDDGSAPLKARIRVTNIEFEEGNWYNLNKYTITAEADELLVNGLAETDVGFSGLINNATESWSVEEGEFINTFKLTHTASATARTTTAGVTGWSQAKTFIEDNLKVGATGTSTFSATSGTTIISNSISVAQGMDGSLHYSNYSISENIDEIDGSYSITETWLLRPSTTSAYETYNISVRKISEESGVTTEATIQGTITGYYDDLADYTARFTAATTYFDTLSSATFYSRITSYTSTNLDDKPISVEISYNPNDGTVNYTYSFNDKDYEGEAFHTYTITKDQSLDDYKTVVGISGNITGRRYEDDTSVGNKFTRAKALWDSIKNDLLQRILDSQYVSEIDDLRENPVSNNVNFSVNDGTISYDYKFDNRQNDNDVNNEDVRESYTVTKNFSKEDGITTYSIEGQVEGLRIQEAGSRDAKWAAALAYFNSTTLSAILTRVVAYGGSFSNTTPIYQEVSKNPAAGTISYNYKYNTQPTVCITGALSEVITVSDENRNQNVQVFASIPIPGRALGPILQNMSTTKEKSRSLDIEAVLPATGNCDFAASLALKPNTDSIVSAATPSATTVFIDGDVETWAWKTGRYTRNVRWIYE